MKIKLTTIIITILLLGIYIAGIFMWIRIDKISNKDNKNNIETTNEICVISSIDDKEIIAIDSKWIADKNRAIEANIYERYKEFFEYPKGRFKITKYEIEKDNIPIISQSGNELRWDELKIGDELTVTKEIGIENAKYIMPAPIYNMKSIQRTHEMFEVTRELLDRIK